MILTNEKWLEEVKCGGVRISGLQRPPVEEQLSGEDILRLEVPQYVRHHNWSYALPKATCSSFLSL